MQGTRTVVVSIDTLTDLLKDYTSQLGDIPADAKPTSLMLKPTEQGKFGIVMESDTWTGSEPPIILNFQIKRVFGVI